MGEARNPERGNWKKLPGGILSSIAAKPAPDSIISTTLCNHHKAQIVQNCTKYIHITERNVRDCESSGLPGIVRRRCVGGSGPDLKVTKTLSSPSEEGVDCVEWPKQARSRESKALRTVREIESLAAFFFFNIFFSFYSVIFSMGFV